MNHRYLYIAGFCLTLCFSACQDDFGVAGNGQGTPLQLFARVPQEFVVSRANNDPVFPSNTEYHLFGTKVSNNTDSWETNYLLASYNKEVIDKSVAKGHGFNNYDAEKNQQVGEVATRFNTDPMGFYGVTIATEVGEPVSESNEKLNGYLKGEYGTDGAPQYYLAYDADEAKRVAFPDLMYSDELTGKKGNAQNILTNSGKIVMPYKHALSRLDFYAAKSDDDSDEGIKDAKITITSITLKDYADGTMSMATGLFTRTGNRGKENGIELKPAVDTTRPDDTSPANNEAKEVVVLGETPYFASTLIFPTTGAEYNGSYLDENGGNKAVTNTDAVYVELKYTYDADGNGTASTPTEKTFTVNLNDNQQYMAFCPHHKYNVTFTFTTTSVVASIVPSYYEYVEDLNDMGLTQVGEPVDFGGFMWAASNLGATSANPLASPEDWEKARGFYYQFGRSIPFYARGSVLDPHPDVAVYGVDDSGISTSSNEYYWDYENARTLSTDNGKTINIPYFDYDESSATMGKEHENHSARAYPYIPVLWEREINAVRNSNPTFSKEECEKQGYKNFLKKYRMFSTNKNTSATTTIDTGQSVPSSTEYDPYEADYIGSEYTANMFVFAAYHYNSPWGDTNIRDWDPSAGHVYSGNNWGKIENDPCPKGWRLPTRKDFLSIFPLNTKYGDISFNGYGGGCWISTTYDDDVNKTHYNSRCFRYDEDTDFNNKPAVYVGIYQDGSGYNEILPADKAESWVMSEVKSGGYKEGWGSVYSIKNQNDAAAYAIRWQVITTDNAKLNQNPLPTGFQPSSANKMPTADNVANGKGAVGRGVLVISKYDLGEGAGKVTLDAQLLDKNGDDVLNESSLADADKVVEGGNQAQYRCIVYYERNKEVGFQPNSTDEEFTSLDWDKPSGVLYLPITGYFIVPGGGGLGLIYPGQECIYWTSDATAAGARGVGAHIKYAGTYDTRYLFLKDDEHRSYGANIRCIRDTSNQ